MKNGRLWRRHHTLNWLKIVHSSCTHDDCVNWPKLKDKDGYGQTRWMIKGSVKWYRMHRLSLIISTGCDHEHLCALHSCHNPSCVNPKHLRWGTLTENNQDREQAKRGRKSKLSEAQVLQLISVSGKEFKQLAKSFGISFGQAYVLCKKYKEATLRSVSV